MLAQSEAFLHVCLLPAATDALLASCAAATRTCAGGAWGGRGIALGLTLQGRRAACSSKHVEVVSKRSAQLLARLWVLTPMCAAAAGCAPPAHHPPKRISLADVRSPSGPAMVVSVCPHLRTSKQEGGSVAGRPPTAAGAVAGEARLPQARGRALRWPTAGLTWARGCHRRWGIAAPASNQVGRAAGVGPRRPGAAWAAPDCAPPSDHCPPPGAGLPWVPAPPPGRLHGR